MLFFVTRVRVPAFIVTLATLFIGRGLGLRITETRALNLPDSFLQLGSARFLSVPLPAWLFAAVLVAAHLALTRTPVWAAGFLPSATIWKWRIKLAFAPKEF